MSKIQEAYTNSNGAEYLGLKPPFSQAFGVTAKHQLDVNTLNNGGGVLLYAQDYSAKKALEILIGDDEISLIKGVTSDKDTIVTNTGITIRCRDIETLLNYKYTKNEEQWQFGEPDITTLKRMRASNFASTDLRDKEEPTETRANIKEKVIKTNQPKPSRDGLISVGQIAEEIGIEPKDARVALRKSKTEKPDAGWAWPKNEVEKIKQLIMKHHG